MIIKKEEIEDWLNVVKELGYSLTINNDEIIEYIKRQNDLLYSIIIFKEEKQILIKMFVSNGTKVFYNLNGNETKKDLILSNEKASLKIFGKK